MVPACLPGAYSVHTAWQESSMTRKPFPFAEVMALVDRYLELQ